MRGLPVLLDLRGRQVALVGEGEAAEAKRRLLERAGAVVVGEEAAVAIAIVVDDEAAVMRLKTRGVLVNAVDRGDRCDITLPAIVERGPLFIAVGTGGASAGLAKALRQRLETMLPAGLGAMVEALASAKPAIRARWPDPVERRRAIDRALAPGGPLDPLIDQPSRAVEHWLAEAGDLAPAAPADIRLRSPDPDDLTLREARLLGSADHVYHRPDVPAAILDRARADAPRTPCTEPPARRAAGLSLDIGWAG